MRIAQRLIRRAGINSSALVAAVQDTSRPTTFQKRLVALKHYLCVYAGNFSTLNVLPETEWPQSIENLYNFKYLLQALEILQQQGMTHPRKKRKSKRQALKGLPSNWRIQLCQRGANGKYALALLVTALLGARPSEVAKGIRVWIAQDETLNLWLLCLHVQGAKVKRQQGQPNRYICYALDDPNTLVQFLVEALTRSRSNELLVDIKSPGNFSKEIQRLGRILWPTHPEPITAYCFRHQWSADIKASGDANAASRGLGHRSAKTRRLYGTANQSNAAFGLRPIRIEADLPVEHHYSLPPAAATVCGKAFQPR